jgi:intracellular multiplication protein IcmX
MVTTILSFVRNTRIWKLFSKHPVKLMVLIPLSLLSISVKADLMNDNPQTNSDTPNTQNLVQYLKNLGEFLGYEIEKSPKQQGIDVNQKLLRMSTTQVLQTYLFNTLLGAIPVNTVSQALSQFVPPNVQGAGAINAFANYSFKTDPYNTPTQQKGTVAVSELVDQKTYQQDPVSQGILNILETPDSSYCMNYDGSTWNQRCTFLYQNKVMTNVIGTLPSTYSFFSYDYVQKFLSQLNSNSLIAPLMYSTENPSNNSTSSGNPNNEENQGLKAQSQAQLAANFIRYASGSLAPISLPKLRDYDTIYNRALNTDKSISPIQQMQAQATLAHYLTNIRTYAAQSSVGLSNLYWILSKRMPQNQSTQEARPTSQAMTEFTMATRRLFNPDMSNSQQWINEIEKASSATVQKEVAVLLAEINYQLYLNRQQEERLLLTNSLMLIQNTKNNQPLSDLSSQLTLENAK